MGGGGGGEGWGRWERIILVPASCLDVTSQIEVISDCDVPSASLIHATPLLHLQAQQFDQTPNHTHFKEEEDIVSCPGGEFLS